MGLGRKLKTIIIYEFRGHPAQLIEPKFHTHIAEYNKAYEYNGLPYHYEIR